MVRLESVGLRYGAGPEILKNISFALAPGEFRFLTGPSGAGKTSLLRMLFLSLAPTRGRMSLFGQDATMINRHALPVLRRRIGIVFQEFRLLDHLTVYENVALPLRIAGMREENYRADVMELLKWVGLSDQAKVLPVVLSGGEQQRTAIARAVIAKPQLLLADEPTGNVDPALAKRLLRLFLELNRLGTTVLIASHDESLIGQARMPVMTLEQGQLKEAA